MNPFTSTLNPTPETKNLGVEVGVFDAFEPCPPDPYKGYLLLGHRNIGFRFLSSALLPYVSKGPLIKIKIEQ